jgi:hypothetical protein
MQADAVLADDGAAADQLPYGPVRRVPLADVVYGDPWGQLYRDHL